jgi:hypothetical protein
MPAASPAEAGSTANQVLWSFEFPLHESLIDDDLGGHIPQFRPLPSFHLLAHRLKVPLHSVHAHRNVVNQ